MMLGMIKLIFKLAFFISLLSISGLLLAENNSVEKVEIGGDFTLTDHHGNKFELQSLRGKLVLVFFGYTYCPDICPTELSSIAYVLRSLKEDAKNVKALFISIDPERDTPEKLKQYVPYYSPQLIGLTGTLAEVNKVADAYHVQRKIHPHDKSNKNYLVDHSANLFVIGTDGKIIHIVPFGLSVEHIQQVVREEIRKSFK